MPTLLQPSLAPNPPGPMAGTAARSPADLRLLRGLVFGYLALWVFEGALRKWILPGLSNPLLVVRDPVLLLIYALAMAKGVFPRNFFIVWIAGLGLLATFVSLFFTETPLAVTAYGLRADYLHLPLIFLLPEVLHRSDLRLIGRTVLVLALGMSVLVLAQFRSPSGGFLNAGAGEGTVMLDSAFGHVRPSGTFSYTNGLTSFTALTLVFFLQNLLEKRLFPRAVWLATLPAVLVMIVLSGSRAAALTLAVLLMAVVCISVVQSRYRASSFKLAAVVGAGVFLVGSFAVFKSGLEVFSSRFQRNHVEQSGFIGRYFEGFAQPFATMERADWTGAGLGMGTNVAAGLLTGQRQRAFRMSEGEGGRVVLENGPVIGLAYLLLRLCIVIYLGTAALRALRSEAATLPVLLFSACFNDLLLGQFAQATELGYATIAGGLCLTASRRAGEPLATAAEEPVAGKTMHAPTTPQPSPERPTRPVDRPVVRGRSAYAAQLHAESTAPSGDRHE